MNKMEYCEYLPCGLYYIHVIVNNNSRVISERCHNFEYYS